jgi:hypothetical protein
VWWWGKLAGIVDDLLHDSPQVSMALGVVEVAELGRSLVEARVGRCDTLVSSLRVEWASFEVELTAMATMTGRLLTEDGATALALVANNSTHGG